LVVLLQRSVVVISWALWLSQLLEHHHELCIVSIISLLVVALHDLVVVLIGLVVVLIDLVVVLIGLVVVLIVVVHNLSLGVNALGLFIFTESICCFLLGRKFRLL